MVRLKPDTTYVRVRLKPDATYVVSALTYVVSAFRRTSRAGDVPGAAQQKIAFAGVARQRRRALELHTRFGGPAKLQQQITADARQQAISPEQRPVRERSDQLEPGRSAVRHRHGHGAVQRDARRRRERRQPLVQRDDAAPVGVVARRGARVARRDRSLRRIWPRRAAKL